MIKIILSAILLSYIVIGIVIYLAQDKMLYQAQPFKENNTKETIKLSEVDVDLFTLNPGKETAVLYFGGNAEYVGSTALSFNTNKDSTAYFVSYRGYGDSTGVPSEAGLYQDAIEIYDILSKKHADITVIGRSLGSGVATYVASKRDVKKLILVTPYDSIASVASDLFPVYPIRFMLKDSYDSEGRAKGIKSQALILIAENDEVITPKHSVKLSESFNSGQVTIKTIKNSGHNSISAQSEYYQYIADFLK